MRGHWVFIYSFILISMKILHWSDLDITRHLKETIEQCLETLFTTTIIIKPNEGFSFQVWHGCWSQTACLSFSETDALFRCSNITGFYSVVNQKHSMSRNLLMRRNKIRSFCFILWEMRQEHFMRNKIKISLYVPRWGNLVLQPSLQL